MLESVRAGEEISIDTRNSAYRFVVVDARERRGRLSGGALGPREHDAVLVGAMPGDPAGAERFDGLRIGRRALFYLTARNGVERLITSMITGLSRKSKSGDRCAA